MIKHSKKRLFLMYLLVANFSLADAKSDTEGKQLLLSVNPYIGTTHEGNQVPGPKRPFGMIHPCPVNNGKTSPKATCYTYGPDHLYGFALTTMVGVGCANYGSVLLKPTMGTPNFEGYSPKFSGEKAKVGYYALNLDSLNIFCEMTAAVRSAIFKFHYKEGNAVLMVDLSRKNDLDSAFFVQKVSANEIAGYKTDGQFCAAGKEILHKLYFVIKVNVSADDIGFKTGTRQLDSSVNEAHGKEIGAYFSFHLSTPKVIEVQTAISYVSIENARLNLKQELEGKSFDQIRKDSEMDWNDKLSRIQVEGGTDEDRTKFYTAIYHTMGHPNILNDVNGEYPAMGNGKTMKLKPGRIRYTLFSLWDTYRTLHPFLTLVYPDIQEEMSRSIMDMYRENGWLPQWELIGKETHVMLGDPASIVLSDTYLKGVRFDDSLKILEAMLNNAENYYFMPQWGYDDVAHIRRAIRPYNQHNGWVPYDYKNGSHRIWATVATTQEYNLADYNIARFAEKIGKQEVANKYFRQSQGYQNLFNPETKFFQQRWANGEWVEPFNPFAGRWPPL